jgi:oligoendopeptidase F
MPRRSAAVTIAIPVDADFPTLMRIPFRLVAILLASLVAVHASAADVADTFTPADNFDLADLYPTPAAWDADAQKLESQFAALAACKGHLGDGVARFRDCIDLRYALHKRYNRLAVYSGEALAADTSVAEAIARDQRADLLGSALGEADAFLDPEVLALGKARIDGYLAADTALAIYRFPLDEVLRRAPHTLDAEGESLVAAFGAMSDTGRNAYSIFTNAEMPWPAIRLAGGGDAKVDQVGYETLRESPVRDDRKRAMDAFFGAYKGFERSFGVLLSGQARQAMAFAKARRYADSITATLDERGIPVAVVDTLIAETDANLATLHRYFRLRARMLGVTEMHYYDIYPPLVKGDYRYTLPQAKALVLDAVAPLGPGYVEAVRRGFASRWMDAPPRPHKETGAHMAGAAYDVHPYVLMSFTGNYESLTTIAHEWGHAMHTSLAAGAQPFATSRYAIFVAEIASTFNEALLLDRMLKAAKGDDERLFYLGSALENLRATFFRQAMFAEFERAFHAKVDRGEPVTGESLTRAYCDILKRYHGDAEGVVHIDDVDCVEWAYIPHFYGAFYVYQYATSVAASSLFAEHVLANEPGARERYLAMLRAGGSGNPYELVRNAGVDLATPAPYRALVARMNAIMDRMEAILAKR